MSDNNSNKSKESKEIKEKEKKDEENKEEEKSEKENRRSRKKKGKKKEEEEKEEEKKEKEEKEKEEEEKEKEEKEEEKKEEEKGEEEKKEEEKEEEENIPEEVRYGKNGPFKLRRRTPREKNIPIFEDKLSQLLYEIKNYSLLVNKVDTYANAIPLGSFCFSISFILYGFYEAKVNKEKDDFLYYILFLFGGIGQIISGIFEYIKGRTFPANLYLLYGIYFFSIYYFYYYDTGNPLILDDDIKPFFYGSWAVLSFPIFIGSIQSNLFFILQTFFAFAFFIVRCIGEYKNSSKLNELVSGILELVTGFISLYICVSQIINEALKFRAIPSVPMNQENDIDIFTK